ncbi:sigma factor-like helix-turn-helix DNA-binding protein [Streptomyces sp. NPDC057702]|uniref:sigma factor-like helix-turn-helix DNA-binding protein n=1 Tax=unclassified Streptomyces TaxID=2593676 RepID=UPI00369CE466
MGRRRAARDARRAREFEAFVAGAGGRLLHAATLLTAEPPQDRAVAERLLTAALADTYARWDQLRGEDPYARTRQELATRFAHTAWRHRHPDSPARGPLAALTPQERLVLVLRLHEGVAEEVVAAALGLPADRVRAICARAVAAVRATPRSPAPDQRPDHEPDPRAVDPGAPTANATDGTDGTGVADATGGTRPTGSAGGGWAP